MGISKYLHWEITQKIIGCAMCVHNRIGAGFQEVIYQRALAMEMEKQGLSFVREFEIPIHYDLREIGSRRVDFFVKEKIMVEIKAVGRIENVHLAQAINYLEAFNIDIGLLINFGSSSLQFKRLNKPGK
ncbi:MAG: GxxExxY protein [Anaerolineaceae bacterium]|nr:GxxExxY protein [Anaerolineaceae bacterium]